MGCAASLPDRNSGALNGLNSSENAAPADAKILRVKLVLLGDSGVGKSCIVLRFVRGQFDATSKVTVGASFLSQTIALQDSTTVKFEIWDTAGQERYSALAPLYYRGAGVAVIVYDITSPESFKKAQYWVKELQKHGSPDIVMALVGNKADLHEKREVLTEDAMELAEKNGMFFIETSAKTADNINELFQDKHMKEDLPKGLSESGALTGSQRSQGLQKSLSGQRATMARLCEEVGVQKILHLIKSGDLEVQIQAVKVVANLAAEGLGCHLSIESNQVKIVEEGGVEALLMLVQSSQNSTILRVASGAIANLAMNEKSQDLIMNKGGAQLLAEMVTKTDDPQTLRMVAGALANLCGNEKFLKLLKEEEGIKGLLTMAQSGNIDIIAQVARGMANFAKCETREIMQGRRKGRSLLLEEGVLEWLTSNSHIDSASTQRHIELALCHLAQNEENANEFRRTGSVTEIVRISVESSRDDIRSLAKKILKSNPHFPS